MLESDDYDIIDHNKNEINNENSDDLEYILSIISVSLSVLLVIIIGFIYLYIQIRKNHKNSETISELQDIGIQDDIENIENMVNGNNIQLQ